MTRHERVRALVHENWYRDVWLFLITVILFIAVLSLYSTQVKVQEGRRFSVRTTCAIESAFAQAGYDVIRQGHDRERARRLASFYIHEITSSIKRQNGVVATRIVNANGSINCAAFAQLSKLNHH